MRVFVKNVIISLSGIVFFINLAWADVSLTHANIRNAINAVYKKYQFDLSGHNADYIPELAKVNSKLFAIAVVTVNGDVFTAGESKEPFAIESIVKPFMYALALEDNNEDTLVKKVGLNATGHRFNSLEAIEERADHLQNPFVNAGAIQTASLIKGHNPNDKWQRLFHFLEETTDEKLFLGNKVYLSETATNQHNQAITHLLNSYHMLSSDPEESLDLYTRACSIMVTTRGLAMMGATLANSGVNPITHKSVIRPRYVRDMLSEMIVNGLYENSGDWWFTVGLPAKSGVGGGIIAIVPGKMAIAVYSPALDEAGNSVRAQKVIKDISEQLSLHLLNT